MDGYYILMEGQGVQQGGEFTKVIDCTFDDENVALRYLTKYLKYDSLDISCKTNLVPKFPTMPYWVLDDKFNIYPISLSHHNIFIGWFLIECKDESILETIISKYTGAITDRDDELVNTLYIKNYNIQKRPEKVIENHYLSVDEDGYPMIEYSGRKAIPYKPSYNDGDMTIPYDLTDAKYRFIKSKELEFDHYTLWLCDTPSNRFFIKQYDINHEQTASMVICNEFLYQYLKPIVKSPELFYACQNNWIYRFAPNIFDERVDDVHEIFNSPYNVSPVNNEFILINSILHYLHIGVLSQRNLIKYNGEYWIFDIWGSLLLEYVNYYPEVKYLVKGEKELLNCLAKSDIIEIRNKVISKLKNCFNLDVLKRVLDDCQKAVECTINHLNTLEVKGDL